ncbi:MarR family winged helix-turn-helix transcriptional regulator [Archangium lansingense]|uniref:MarR family transcriptional regulator n=1 Tax=Archangium lansingense TaxID=2995310 RepID=A0ABT4A8Z5_9BACT|nr:MarR family transcriptional regulator [Archangium lansinium]MCY1078071.1 MarR family transcriptional regulator [Archangium lansinium]
MTRSDPLIEHAERALQLMSRLHRWAATSVQANHLGGELSLRQLTMLYAIRQGVSSPGLLARRLLVTPAVITGLLDRLERQGYVRREAEPDDRRRLRMVLTEAGLAVSQRVRQALTGDLAAQFASASPAELKELGRALDLMERALGALEQHTPSPPEEGLEDEEVRPTRRRRVPPASKGRKK